MSEEVHPQSLLGRIMALVPDPRGRRGRRFPLVGIVAMLLRGRKYWAALVRVLAPLGLPVEPPAWIVIPLVQAQVLGLFSRGLRPLHHHRI